jgi:hypothetical protein
MFASQMALLGFYFFCLSLSLPEQVTLWSGFILVQSERERGEKEERREKKKEERRKKPR